MRIATWSWYPVSVLQCAVCIVVLLSGCSAQETVVLRLMIFLTPCSDAVLNFNQKVMCLNLVFLMNDNLSVNAALLAVLWEVRRGFSICTGMTKPYLATSLAET